MAKVSGGGRWFAAVASIVASVAMFYSQANPTGTPCCAAPPAAPEAIPVGQTSLVAAAPSVVSAAEAELLAASAPMAAQDVQLALSAGRAQEDGLQVHTIWAARAISAMFLEIESIGGHREDPLPWHPNGLAIDVMIPNYESPEGIELGNQIAGYALANAERWGVLHVIWRQGLYPGVGAPSWTADYGSPTANHFDHVHIATNGGGYPTGDESYYFSSMTRG